ncbi:MAG: hypothetical protein ACI81P_000753 [Neolewinella sp.]|jgi:hypothetical protein
MLVYGERAANGVIIIRTKGKVIPRADYTLTPAEIPAELFSLYQAQDFGAGKKVVYLLNGQRTKLRKTKKTSTTKISSIKVYQSEFKVNLMGYSKQEVVVDVILR